MTDITIRRATGDDIQAIVDMLADDPLGATRESPSDLAPYRVAFAAIDANPHQLLLVAERESQVIGTAQLSFMPGLSHRGMLRADIEAVRIHADARGDGLGSTLITRCIDEARAHGCGMIQLTSNASRVDARRFYERLGFTASHIGFKMSLAAGAESN